MTLGNITLTFNVSILRNFSVVSAPIVLRGLVTDQQTDMSPHLGCIYSELTRAFVPSGCDFREKAVRLLMGRCFPERKNEDAVKFEPWKFSVSFDHWIKMVMFLFQCGKLRLA